MPGHSLPNTHRRGGGYALGFLQAGLTFGYLLGALTRLLAQAFSAEEIPRLRLALPFLLGGVFGVIGCGCRLSETPVFLARERKSSR